MRTEDAYQRRGLGAWLVREGMRRLRAAGCTRLSVTYVSDEAAALYTGAGYVPTTFVTTWQRAG